MTEGDVARSGERAPLTAVPATLLSGPSTCVQQQHRVEGGGFNTGTLVESADGPSSGDGFSSGQQQQGVDSYVDGSLARPEICMGFQSVGPGTRKKGVKFNVDPNLIIDAGLNTGGVGV